MKIPFLHNIRRGLATNSSSSHSLVFYNNERSSDDLESGKYIDTDFGWNNFTLDTLGEKLVYALTAVVYRETDWDTVATPELVADLRARFGHLFPELDDDAYWINAIGGHVDHQSTFSVDAVTLAALRDKHSVVYGGNDNSDYDPVTDSGRGRYGREKEDEKYAKLGVDLERTREEGWGL